MNTSGVRLMEITSERNAIDSRLAEHKARYNGERLQWDTKHDKLYAGGDADDGDSRAKADLLQIELQVMNEGYLKTRQGLRDQRQKLEDEGEAISREARRLFPGLKE
jgi:hypothetical protein